MNKEWPFATPVQRAGVCCTHVVGSVAAVAKEPFKRGLGGTARLVTNGHDVALHCIVRHVRCSARRHDTFVEIPFRPVGVVSSSGEHDSALLPHRLVRAGGWVVVPAVVARLPNGLQVMTLFISSSRQHKLQEPSSKGTVGMGSPTTTTTATTAATPTTPP